MLKIGVNHDGFKRLRSQAEALRVSEADLRGPVLVELGNVHRRQQMKIFTSEGAAGAGGRFARLNERYEKRKKRLFPRRKILHLSGETRERFTKPTNPYYVQEYVSAGQARGVFRFGARSNVAAAHLHGNPALAPEQSATSRKVFGGVAPRLPVRDMISKTAAQVKEFSAALAAWYSKRVRQVIRGQGALLASTRPR